MNGNKDKTLKLYKRFISTTLFRKYLHDKKREIVERELKLLEISLIKANITS